MRLLRQLRGKESACSAGDLRDLGSVPGQEDPLDKEMTTHPSILAWRIPWMKEPGGLLPLGSQRVGHNLLTNEHHHTQNTPRAHTRVLCVCVCVCVCVSH